LAWLLVQHGELVGKALSVVGLGISAFIVWYAVTLPDKVARDRLLVAFVLILFSMVFWAFFEQAGSSMNLFTDRNVDRKIFSFDIPASIFQSVNPAFILLLTLPVSFLWAKLHAIGREPSTPLKFGLGIIQLGLGFAALYVGAVTARDTGVVSLFWLVLGYLLHTTGELCLSPVGLSMITKLSPAKIGGLMMGAWFLSSAFAQYVAALIAMLTGVSGEEEVATKIPPPSETVMIYGSVFGGIAAIAIVVGIALSLGSGFLAKRMHGVR
jgi:POT family proton-dependent oligopeptide transporter